MTRIGGQNALVIKSGQNRLVITNSNGPPIAFRKETGGSFIKHRSLIICQIVVALSVVIATVVNGAANECAPRTLVEIFLRDHPLHAHFSARYKNPSLKWEEIEKLAPDELTDWRTLATRSSDLDEDPAIDSLGNELVGYGWKELQTATYRGEKVFVKTSKATLGKSTSQMRSIVDVEKEIFWTTFLSEFDWGPKFIGAFQRGNHPALVTRYIDGYHVHGATEIQDGMKITQKTIDRLEEFKKFVKEKKIIIRDLQIRLDRNGTPWIIDPESFGYGAHFDELIRSEERIDRIIDNLRVHCCQ